MNEELAAGSPFPFSAPQLCEIPLHCQGRAGGGSQRGVSLFTLQQDSRAT